MATDRAERSDPEDLAIELAVTREELDRLRSEYARVMRTQYRRASLGLAAVGVIAVLGGLVFPAQRSLLFTIGAIGLFTAVLTAYLTPERFVAASVGERTYAQQVANLEALVRTLGLSERRMYVPVAHPDGRVRLFIPQGEPFEIPASEELEALVIGDVPADRRGISLWPTGEALLDVLEAGGSTIEDDPLDAVDVAADGLMHTFELADRLAVEPALADHRVSVAVTDSTYGSIDRLDHPIPSTVACSLARAIDHPVEVRILSEDDRADAVVVCTWDDAQTE